MKKVKVFRDRELLWAEAKMVQYPWEAMKGLLGKTTMTDEELMIFPHNNSIHTFFMKIGIDVVFLDIHFRIIQAIGPLKAWKVCTCRSAYYTLEMKEKMIQKHQLRIGQTLWWEEDGQITIEFALIIAVFILAMVIAIPNLLRIFQLYVSRLLIYMSDI